MILDTKLKVIFKWLREQEEANTEDQLSVEA